MTSDGALMSIVTAVFVIVVARFVTYLAHNSVYSLVPGSFIDPIHQLVESLVVNDVSEEIVSILRVLFEKGDERREGKGRETTRDTTRQNTSHFISFAQRGLVGLGLPLCAHGMRGPSSRGRMICEMTCLSSPSLSDMMFNALSLAVEHPRRLPNQRSIQRPACTPSHDPTTFAGGIVSDTAVVIHPSRDDTEHLHGLS